MCSIASAASDLLSWRSWTSFCFTACCKATSSARKSPPLKWINLSPQAVSHSHRFDVVVYKRTFAWTIKMDCMYVIPLRSNWMSEYHSWLYDIYKWMLWLGLIVIELTHDYFYRIPFITVLWTGYLMLSNISVFCLIHLPCWYIVNKPLTVNCCHCPVAAPS